MKKERGITLVALVVTIIVLIILVGVSISLILEQNGIINKAQEAKTNYQIAKEKEQVVLDEYENEIIHHTGIASSRDTLSTTILYPNGTSENPPTINNNQRIEIDNPYPGHTVYSRVEVCYNGIWGDPGFIFAQGEGGYGVKASQYWAENTDKIVVQSGSIALSGLQAACGCPFSELPSVLPTSLPYRLIVVCLN